MLLGQERSDHRRGRSVSTQSESRRSQADEALRLYQSGLNAKQVAAIMGVSHGTVGNRLKSHPDYQPRGKRKLPTPPLGEAYEAGATLESLARETGVSTQTIARRLRDEGVSLRPYTGKRGQKILDRSHYDADQLREMSSRGMTAAEIGDHLGIAPESVRRAMVRRSIPRQEPKARAEKNHFWRGGYHVDKDGYVLKRAPQHPAANSTKMVRVHRLVMEHHLDRFLGPDEVVDHRNGDKSDNRLENLRVYPKNSAHLSDTLTGVPRGTAEQSRERRRESVLRARQRVAAILAGSKSDADPLR